MLTRFCLTIALLRVDVAVACSRSKSGLHFGLYVVDSYSGGNSSLMPSDGSTDPRGSLPDRRSWDENSLSQQDSNLELR